MYAPVCLRFLTYDVALDEACRSYCRAIAAWPGDTELLPHLSRVLQIGSLEAEVTYCEPIPFSTGSNRKAVSRAVETAIETALHSALRSPA